MNDDSQRGGGPRRGGVKLPGYDDLRLVGRGGFARVYRAWQSPFNREVAVKVLSRRSVDSRAYRLFDRERSALGALSSHPNIVTVYDSGETDDGALFLAMEYVSGGSLAERLAQGPVDWREVLRLGIKLTGALETAHRSGVLHRDIKPENVLMSEFGEPQLADFGIARLVASSQTRSLEVNLSVPFAPPELLDGADPSVRSDVYSLACTLHSLLLGRPSFLAERSRENSMVPLMVRIHGEPPPDLRHHGVPDSVCRVLERALAKDPSGRQATALEFGKEFQAVESALGLTPTELPVPGAGFRPETRSASIVAPPDSHPTPQFIPGTASRASPSRRRRRILLAALAVAAVLAVVAVGVVFPKGDAEEQAGGEDTTTTTSPPKPATTAPPHPLPSNTGPLPPGFYFLGRFDPRTELRLEEGWRRPRADRSHLVELELASAPGALVSILAADRLVDPGRTYASLAEARRSGAAAAPDDLVAWLGAHPSLTISSAVPVTGAGITGQRLDVVIRGSNAICGRAPRECVALFHFETTVFVLLPENRNRLYVFRAGGKTVLVTVEARPDRFEAVVAATERFISTMEIGQP